MPVTKSKNRAKTNAAARKREQTKRDNRVRAMLGNQNMSSSEINAYIKAKNDKSTPIEFLTDIRKIFLESLSSFQIIRDTKMQADEQPEVRAGIEQLKPGLMARVDDAVEGLTGIENALDEVYHKHEETMRELGDTPAIESWVVCMGPIQDYDHIQETLMTDMVAPLFEVVQDILNVWQRVEELNITQVQMEQANG